MALVKINWGTKKCETIKYECVWGGWGLWGQVLPTLWGPNVPIGIVKPEITSIVGISQRSLRGK